MYKLTVVVECDAPNHVTALVHYIMENLQSHDRDTIHIERVWLQ